MPFERRAIERERHWRAGWYAVIAFGLAVFGYFFLRFDYTQTYVYAIACFVMLNVVNFRSMFSPLPAEPVEKREPNS